MTAETTASEKQKVVLAYSGGLDTSVVLKWLQVEKGLDVIAICGNVGQDEEDLEYIKQKALDMGAIASEAIDMREEYADKYLTKALAANGLYENSYPLLSALSRPLISKYLVEAAHTYGAAFVAHGCTGKGNDQVRFETSIKALDPNLTILAPVREWNLHTREDEMAWAKENGVPVPVTPASPYSIDDNLWGRAIECGVLENPWNEPPEDIWQTTTNPADAPDEPDTAATLTAGAPAVYHGMRTYFCQDDQGGIAPVYSISAGLDYPGVGPEHAALHDAGRARYVPVTDDEAVDAFEYLSLTEGIIPAIESSHAIAYARTLVPTMRKDQIVIVTVSGRGDKDVAAIARYRGSVSTTSASHARLSIQGVSNADVHGYRARAPHAARRARGVHGACAERCVRTGHRARSLRKACLKKVANRVSCLAAEAGARSRVGHRLLLPGALFRRVAVNGAGLA